MTPYYVDDAVTLYHADYRTVLAAGVLPPIDVAVTDPPYNETSLTWDRWPVGWPGLLAAVTSQMWCFGSMRLFLDRRGEFSDWRFAQDIVWEKHNGSSFLNDRFRRVHEHATHWYRGKWRDLSIEPQTTSDATARTVRRKAKPAQWQDAIGASVYTVNDGGPRLMRSVIHARSLHGRAVNATQKPLAVVEPLVRYSCPPGGTVLDPFAGSGTTGVAAAASGRRAVLIEAREDQCAATVARLRQNVLPFSQ